LIGRASRRRRVSLQGFKSQASAQRLLTTHAAIYNTFYVQPHLIRRSTLRAFRSAALRTWNDAVAASFGSSRMDRAWVG
jgi:hypothetical protein